MAIAARCLAAARTKAAMLRPSMAAAWANNCLFSAMSFRSSQASTEVEWRAIQETRQLVSIPSLRESILEGMATDLSELSSEPGW